MQLRLTRHLTAHELLDAARAFLVAREAENNLLLGIAATVAEQPARFGKEPPYFATIHRDTDAGQVVAVALRTPPHGLVLSEADASARTLILDDARARHGSLPSVLGPKHTANAFADAWCAATGAKRAAVLSERIYRVDATTLTNVVGASGSLRAATVADRAWLLTYWRHFVDEALPDHPDEKSGAERAVDARLNSKQSGVALWIVDDKPVSFAGFAGPTPHGIRIGPVYTPKEHRKKGYGSAVTAALSKQLLDGGRKFVFLFTDLANPTSNEIYMNIGYREVADVDQISFKGDERSEEPG